MKKVSEKQMSAYCSREELEAFKKTQKAFFVAKRQNILDKSFEITYQNRCVEYKFKRYIWELILLMGYLNVVIGALSIGASEIPLKNIELLSFLKFLGVVQVSAGGLLGVIGTIGLFNRIRIQSK